MAGDTFEVLVRERTGLAAGVLGLELVAPDGGALPGAEPGAHIDLLLPSGLVRQYSLCTPDDRPGTWRIAVLREPDGRGGSAELHDTVAAGTRLRAAGPRNRFPLLPADDLLFIAGGIGITPLLPMLAEAERRGTRWRLLYGGRSRSSMAFLPELAVYGDRVTVVPQDERGLPDLEGWLSGAPAGARVYCCGPEPLLQAVRERCDALPRVTLHTERFTPTAPAAAPECADTGFEAVLKRSGKTVPVPAGTSVLRAVRDAGVAVLASCEEGTCGTCETVVLEGTPEHRDSLLTEEERAAGDLMLICVSRSRGPRLVLDL
ncbi:PDR/VanB family oxidoreductase [Streptomyces rubradiris]|uniref:Ferredoxin n=1 Tax=Streptomyces rubradiris TaxID=285531 RepID=A0ABQ3RQQ8_STRRR|nr:PDR/VanB family oxidoreductase [Streptomyces rubradiris]GHH24947.1 ferredoxin [Streptomyces rubradiris]GHI58195.1 ferredoxin [Streptomyces rubradiris]